MSIVVSQKGFTDEDLEIAFNKVKTPGDWKARINARIPITTQRDLDMITESIQFYTATDAEVKTSGNAWIICADGYRMGPAGP